MDKKKDTLEQRIAEDFKKLAQAEEEKTRKEAESEKDIRMPEGTKEAVRARLDEEIKKIEAAEVYDRLSEEDRRALELGRKVLREEKEGKAFEEKTRKRHRRPRRVYIAVAAVLVATLAVSVSAMGGPERMVRMVRHALSQSREVEKINSSDENLVIVEENEEEAYQKLRNYFGVEVVRITKLPSGMQFVEMVLDSENSVAEIRYQKKEKTIISIISSNFRQDSLGIDVEDRLEGSYTKDTGDCIIEIKEYLRPSGSKKQTAQFIYKGLEYFFVTTVSDEEFESLIKNIHFY